MKKYFIEYAILFTLLPFSLMSMKNQNITLKPNHLFTNQITFTDPHTYQHKDKITSHTPIRIYYNYNPTTKKIHLSKSTNCSDYDSRNIKNIFSNINASDYLINYITQENPQHRGFYEIISSVSPENIHTSFPLTFVWIEGQACIGTTLLISFLTMIYMYINT